MPGLQEYHKALQDEGSPLAAGSTAAEFEQQWKDNVGGLYQSVKKTHPDFGVDQATFEGKFQEAPAVDTATDAVNEPASDGLSPAVDPLSQGLGPLSPQGVGEAQLEQINQAGETEADPFAIPEAATQEGKSTTAERAANVRTGVLGQKYEVGTTDVFGRPIQEKEKEETSGFTPISGDESPLVMGSKALNTAEVLKKEYPEGSEEGRYEEGTKALSHGMTAMSKNIEAMARIFDASYGEGKYAELSSKHAILAQDAASDPQDKEKQVALEIFEKENERMLSNVAYVEAAKAQTVQQRGGQEMQQIIRDTPTYQKELAYLKTLQKEKDKEGLHLSSGVWLDPTDTVDQWAVGALARAAKNVGAVIGSQSLQESARAWEREYSPPSNLTRNGIEYLVTLPSGKKASIDPETKEIQYVLNSDGTKDDEYEVTAEDTDKAKSSDPSKTFNMQSLSWQTASVIGDLAIDVAVTMGTGGVAGAALRSTRTGMAVGQFISPALRVQYQAQDDAVRSGASANEAYVDQLTMGIGYGLASRINPLESQLAGRIMGHGSNSAMRKINQYAAGQITASDLAKHVTGGILKSGGKEILEEHFEQEVMENVINATNNQYLGGTRDVGFSTQDELLTTTIVAGAVGLLGGTGNVNWSKSELATSAIKKMLADPKQARAMLEGIRAKDPQEASRKERILEAVLTDYENADVPESKQAELAGLLVTSYNLSDEITQHDPDSPVAASNQEKLNRINEKIKRIVNPELFAPEPDKPDPAALPDDNDTPDNVTEAPTFDVNEDAAAASDAELAAQVILDGEEDTPARQEAVARGIDLTDLEAVAAGETRKAGQELGSVAAAVAAGAELSPQQQQTYDSNKEIIDGLTAAPPKIGDTVTIGTGKAATKFTFDADGWTFSPSKDTQIKVPKSGLRSVEAAFYAQSRVAPSVTPPVAPSVGASFTSKDGQTFTVTGPLDAQGNIPVDGPAGRSIPVNPNSQLGKALIAAPAPATAQTTAPKPRAVKKGDTAVVDGESFTVTRGSRTGPVTVKNNDTGETVTLDQDNPIVQAIRETEQKKKTTAKKTETAPVEEVKIQPKAEEKLPDNNRPPLSTLINSRGAPSKQGLAAQAEKALKSLKAMGANVRFVIYDSVEDIPANRRRYAPGSRGFMVKAGESYTIYISSQLANPFTVFHEAAHVAFDLFVGQNDVDKANKIHTVLRSVLINGTKEEKALSARVDKLTEQYNRDVQGEEYFAELVGVLAASRQQISKPALKKVFEAINKFLSEVFNTRVQLFPEDATVSDLIDFVNTLAGNLSTGEMTVLAEAAKLGLSIDKTKGKSVRKSQLDNISKLKDVDKHPENYGYHGGTLEGKSDYLTDSYRGDLPYTGYYFFGDKERALERGNRATGKEGAIAVDFTNYNLIKLSGDQYIELKFALKAIEDAMLRGNKEKLKSTIERINQWIPEIGSKLSEGSIEKLWEIWSNKRDVEFSKPRVNFKPNTIERFETTILKSIGYEGIDIRGTEFDNSSEGSVIFDLKPDTLVDLIPNTESNNISKNALQYVQMIQQIPTSQEDGVTLNLDGTKFTGGGLIVPIASQNLTAQTITPEAVAAFAQANQRAISVPEATKIGLYSFPDSDMVSIDLNLVVPPSNKDAALEFGRQAGQESLFDLDTFTNIKTGAPGTNPRQFSPDELAFVAEELTANRVPDFAARLQKIPAQTITQDPVISRMNQMEAYRNQAVAAMDSRADFTDGDIEAIERSMEVDDEFVRHQTLFSENGILEAKHMARIVSHVDPRYLFHVMDHIRSQREKMLNGDLPLRDMIKPYLYAVMSQGSGSQPVAGIEAHMGMKIPDIYVEDGQLRPEGATAFVLAETEVGKRLLDEVESGNISQETSEGFMSLMSIFGKGATYDLSDPAAKNTSTRYFHLFDTPPDGAVNLTNFALEMESLRNGDAFREGTHHEQLRRLKGIGPGKTGFMGHFFGIGDRGTIDIREVTLWLYGTDSDLKTKPELKKALELAKGNDLSPIQREFLKRIEEVGKAVGFDEDVAAYMGHHLLWDFVKGEFTHHAGLYYAITGTAPLYQDAIQRAEENRTQQKSLLDKRYSPELDLFATTQLVELIRTAHGNGYSIDEQIQANKRLKTSFKAWQKSPIMPTLDTTTVVDQSALKAVETRLYEMIEGIEPSEREAGYRADIAVQESVRHMEKRC